MGNKRSALSGPIKAYFKHTDGSIIRSLCTANKEYYEKMGGLYTVDGLYDLEVKKRIPDYYLSLECTVFDSDEEEIDTRKEIDIFLEKFIKNTW